MFDVLRSGNNEAGNYDALRVMNRNNTTEKH